MAKFLIFLGSCLLAYPWISNLLYENRSYSEIQIYQQEVENLGEDRQAELMEEAKKYNTSLWERQRMMTNPFDLKALLSLGDDIYPEMLSSESTNVMAYLEIPSISLYLPVYHGSDDETLQAGIGHLEGSSLPVGGENTHAVLTGHSGLSGKKLFTDLEEMEEGDIFYIHVLGEVLTYQVVQIQTVLPEETDKLRVTAEKDLVTLMTCTPYGINSHRLLVTGERTEVSQDTEKEWSGHKLSPFSSQWMKDYRNALFTALAGLGIILAVRSGLRRKRERRNYEKGKKEGKEEE